MQATHRMISSLTVKGSYLEGLIGIDEFVAKIVFGQLSWMP